MVAYNFQKQFAGDVETLLKQQTIRAQRVRPHAKVGDELQLYTGMRSKGCRLLLRAVCIKSCKIIITPSHIYISDPPEHIIIGEPHSRDVFARADGFDDFAAMRSWFSKTHDLPFEGQLIRWEPKESSYDQD